MRILILVLSYNASPFDVLMRTQQDTFDSVEVEGVKTIYYHGGSDNDMFNYYPHTRQLEMPCGDKYYYMGEKMKLALEYIDMVKEFDFDIVFRTNSSSYIQKSALVQFAKTLPKEKLYAGWEFIDSEDFSGGCISGAGIFLSRDCVDILREQLNPTTEREEDVEIGRILRRNGIVAMDDKSRYDIDSVNDYTPTNLYHYRCKGSTGNRLIDAHNMVMLHKKIVNNG